MKARLPNFLLVGAARSGTSSLFNYLRQHPEVFLPEKKELRFFVSSVYRDICPEDPQYPDLIRSMVFTLEDYVRLFEEAGDKQAVGEASVAYLYFHRVAIPNILKHLGNVKILMILRDPVERAFSSHNHLVQDYAENLPFERCLEMEEERRAARWAPIRYYKDFGYYYSQVKAYIENFRDVQICLHDDLENDAAPMMEDVFRFLNVDPNFVPDVEKRYNVSGVPRHEILDQFVKRPSLARTLIKPLARALLSKRIRDRILQRWSARDPGTPEMKEETRRTLRKLYREDILKLQDLTRRDLSRWLS